MTGDCVLLDKNIRKFYEDYTVLKTFLAMTHHWCIAVRYPLYIHTFFCGECANTEPQLLYRILIFMTSPKSAASKPCALVTANTSKWYWAENTSVHSSVITSGIKHIPVTLPKCIWDAVRFQLCEGYATSIYRHSTSTFFTCQERLELLQMVSFTHTLAEEQDAGFQTLHRLCNTVGCAIMCTFCYIFIPVIKILVRSTL